MANPQRQGSRLFNVETVVPAGGTQATAAVIPAKSSPAVIVAVGDGIGGILLPPASKGMTFFIKNTGTGGFGGGLLVYPATGHQINTLSANVAMTMATLTSAAFIAYNSTTWYTFSFLPS